LRFAQDTYGDLRHDSERPLGTDDQAEKIGTGCIRSLAADLHEIAVRQDQVDREHVMNREAVLQTVRAA
jgi:hypothetical protein